eukprot:5938216-Prymnesium_polylepis.1
MCGMKIPRKNCLIYSFGSKGEDSWERAMFERRPECQIHIFDPTLPLEEETRMVQASAKYGARFHSIGLSHREERRPPRRGGQENRSE